MNSAEEVLPNIHGLRIYGLDGGQDERGVVREFFRESRMAPEMRCTWRQMNITESRRGAVRGLHAEPMNKLVGIVQGEAFGVFVDVRPSSPSYGRVATVELSLGVAVFVPRGVCNGYQSTGMNASQYLYCFDEEWRPGMGGISLTPLDPELGIPWPIPIDPNDRGQISHKDAAAPTLRQVVNRSRTS